MYVRERVCVRESERESVFARDGLCVKERV